LSAINGLLGQKINIFLLYFELFFPSLVETHVVLGRIIAAFAGSLSIFFATAPLVLASIGGIIYVESTNYWTFQLCSLPEHLSQTDIYRSFLRLKIFNKIANELARYALLFVMVACFVINVVCNYVLIAMVSKLNRIAYGLMVMLSLALNIIGFFLFPAAAKMNMHSNEFKKNFGTTKDKYISRLAQSFTALRIEIGRYYIVKMDTHFTFLMFIYDYTITVLML